MAGEAAAGPRVSPAPDGARGSYVVSTLTGHQPFHLDRQTSSTATWARCQTQLDMALNAASAIPFVNHAVGNLRPAAQFINNLRANLNRSSYALGTQQSVPTDQDIQQAFFNALGNPGGLNVLVDLNGNPRGTRRRAGHAYDRRIQCRDAAARRGSPRPQRVSASDCRAFPSRSMPRRVSLSPSAYDYELAFNYNVGSEHHDADPSVRLRISAVRARTTNSRCPWIRRSCPVSSRRRPRSGSCKACSRRSRARTRASTATSPGTVWTPHARGSGRDGERQPDGSAAASATMSASR